MGGPPPALRGYWRIIEMESWEDDDLDAGGPAHVVFDPDGLGEFRFCRLEGWFDASGREPALSFTWEGQEGDRKRTGSGKLHLDAKGRLTGRFVIDKGESSAFTAVRSQAPGRRPGSGPLR